MAKGKNLFTVNPNEGNCEDDWGKEDSPEIKATNFLPW
jgi:hypothetical protein